MKIKRRSITAPATRRSLGCWGTGTRPNCNVTGCAQHGDARTAARSSQAGNQIGRLVRVIASFFLDGPQSRYTAVTGLLLHAQSVDCRPVHKNKFQVLVRAFRAAIVARGPIKSCGNHSGFARQPKRSHSNVEALIFLSLRGVRLKLP